MAYLQAKAPSIFTRSILSGAGWLVLLPAVYFGIVGLISGMDFAREEFVKFWYFFVPLSLGFAIQVGLYTYLRGLVGRHGATGKAVAVSGLLG